MIRKFFHIINDNYKIIALDFEQFFRLAIPRDHVPFFKMHMYIMTPAPIFFKSLVLNGIDNGGIGHTMRIHGDCSFMCSLVNEIL